MRLLQEWRDALVDPDRAYAPSTRGQPFAITDQLALNMLLEKNIVPIASADPDGDWKVILAHDKRLRLLPLPSVAFSNGHVFFYQHLQDINGIKVRRHGANFHYS
jgi:hypothetical protein